MLPYDWKLAEVNTVDVQTELCMACTCGNHRRIVTYKIFINKQLIYANVTIRLALFIYINIPVHRLSSSRAKLANDVGIAVLAILSHEDGIRSFGPLSSEDVAVVVDFNSFDLQSLLTGKIFVQLPAFLSEPGSARYSSAPSITTV